MDDTTIEVERELLLQEARAIQEKLAALPLTTSEQTERARQEKKEKKKERAKELCRSRFLIGAVVWLCVWFLIGVIVMVSDGSFVPGVLCFGFGVAPFGVMMFAK
jgi:hypothetical protein